LPVFKVFRFSLSFGKKFFSIFFLLFLSFRKNHFLIVSKTSLPNKIVIALITVLFSIFQIFFRLCFSYSTSEILKVFYYFSSKFPKKRLIFAKVLTLLVLNIIKCKKIIYSWLDFFSPDRPIYKFYIFYFKCKVDIFSFFPVFSFSSVRFFFILSTLEISTTTTITAATADVDNNNEHWWQQPPHQFQKNTQPPRAATTNKRRFEKEKMYILVTHREKKLLENNANVHCEGDRTEKNPTFINVLYSRRTPRHSEAN
jgi:hypothetical protein